jgi:hypothetical protein
MITIRFIVFKCTKSGCDVVFIEGMAESWDGTCPFTAYFFQVFRLILDLIIRRYFSPLLLPSLWFNRNHLDPVVLSGFHQALMKSLLAQKRVSYGYV